MRIAPETEADGAEVEALLDLCFSPGRTALSSYRLRDGVAPLAPACLVAREDGAVGGAIRFWPVRVGAARLALLGPVAVHPTRQGEGLGAALIRAGLARAAAAGWDRVLLVGDAPYYGRFGFVVAEGIEMPPPTNPARVLARGDLSGLRGPVTRDLPPGGGGPT